MSQLPQSFVGSISEGTLRTQDLLPRFVQVLEQADPQHGLVQEYQQVWDAARLLSGWMGKEWIGNPEDVLEAIGFWEGQQASWTLNEELFDALNEVAPKGTYFGSSEGDGASFGFWPTLDDTEDWIEELEDEPDDCGVQGCPEHPSHNGGEHTYEQHHSPEDHVGDGPCQCTAYVEPVDPEPSILVDEDALVDPEYLASATRAAEGETTHTAKLPYHGVLIERPCKFCDTVNVHFHGGCDSGLCLHPDCFKLGLRYTSQYNHYLHAPSDHAVKFGTYVPSLIEQSNEAFEALIIAAKQIGQPSMYTSDLFRDWQRLTGRGPWTATEVFKIPDRFVWCVRDTGTDIIDVTTMPDLVHIYLGHAEKIFVWTGHELVGVEKKLASEVVAGWRAEALVK